MLRCDSCFLCDSCVLYFSWFFIAYPLLYLLNSIRCVGFPLFSFIGIFLDSILFHGYALANFIDWWVLKIMIINENPVDERL